MEFTVKNTKFSFVVVVDQRYLTGSVLEKPEIGELEVGNSAHADLASTVLFFIAIIVYLQLNKSNDTKLENN